MAGMTVTGADAGRRLSDLVGVLAQGKERIVITKRGNPTSGPVHPEGESGHLAKAPAWLDQSDEFTEKIGTLLGNRAAHVPGFNALMKRSVPVLLKDRSYRSSQDAARR